MLSHFAWKTIASISVASIICSLIFRKQIMLSEEQNRIAFDRKTPLWMSAINCFFIFTCVVYHKYTPFIIGLFFIFLGWHEVTKEHQGPLKIRESLLVGFFLAGLIILGNMQTWWVQPLIKDASLNSLFFGNLILTGVMDNAALTYLASQITNLTLEQKLSIVSGAIAGGGLTVIANAPNPIGFGILSKYFNQGTIKSLYLFLWAIQFTLVTVFFYRIF